MGPNVEQRENLLSSIRTSDVHSGSKLTLMLLVGWVVEPHCNEDEEDEERPDDLHQKLELEKQRHRYIDQYLCQWDLLFYNGEIQVCQQSKQVQKEKKKRNQQLERDQSK